jgi:hypothetical protein
MLARNALDQFNNWISQAGVSLKQLSASDAIDRMVNFYVQVRADDCELEADGDMLLFQWGVYNWGTGEFFEYNITRQFIVSEIHEDDQEEWTDDFIGQLSLTLKYAPSSELRNMASGNRWCRHPNEIADFVAFIDQHEATAKMRNLTVEAIELTFGNAE